MTLLCEEINRVHVRLVGFDNICIALLHVSYTGLIYTLRSGHCYIYMVFA